MNLVLNFKDTTGRDIYIYIETVVASLHPTKSSLLFLLPRVSRERKGGRMKGRRTKTDVLEER